MKKHIKMIILKRTMIKIFKLGKETNRERPYILKEHSSLTMIKKSNSQSN